MSAFQLDRMTAKELRELREKIDDKIVRKQDTAKVELREMFAKMAADTGLSVHDVLGSAFPDKAGRGKGRKHTAMRDKVTGVIWSGIGRMPFKFDRKRAEPVA